MIALGDIRTRLGGAVGSRRWLAPAVGTAFVVFVVLVVMYPLVRSFVATFFVDDGAGLGVFGDMVDTRGFDRAAINTAVYVVGTLILATGIALLLAWANERTDAALGRVSQAMPLIPLMVPTIGSALGYVMMFSDQGVANILLRQLLGIDGRRGPVSVTNLPGLIVITSINLAPLAYLIIANAFRNIDPALEEASRVTGASTWRSLRKITLPVIRPALASGALVVGIMCAGAFTFPLIVGTPGDVTVLSVFVYRQFVIWPPNEQMAMAVGFVLLIVVQFATFVQLRLARSAKRAVISGKSSQQTKVQLGAWKLPVRLFVLGYLAAVLLPIVGLLYGALQPYRVGSLDWSTFGLENFSEIFGDPVVRRALVNSFKYAAVAATVVMAVASVLTYAASRTDRAWGRLIGGVLFVPAAIPHTVMGIAFLYTFSRSPIVLYGSSAMLVLVYVAMYLPQGAAAASAAVSQASHELSEASYVSGAGQFRTLTHVVLPQLLPGVVAGWIVVFVMSVNEVTASALIAGVRSPVVGQVAVDYFNNGRLGQVAAIALTVTVATTVVVAVAAPALMRMRGSTSRTARAGA